MMMGRKNKKIAIIAGIVLLLISCGVFFWKHTHPVYHSQMERIGSPRAGGVPAGMIVQIEYRIYQIALFGKFDVVGALITSEGKKHNISLSQADLDILATTLNGSIASQAQGLHLQVMHPKKREYVSRTLAVNSPAERLLRKLIMIFHLPEYHVKPGDTLSKIVTQHFQNTITVEDMLAVNPGLNPDYIDRMVLKIPARAESSPEIHPTEPPKQDFPIAELQYRDKTEYFYLYNDYGFIAQWEEDGEKPTFFLYDKSQNSISVTEDLNTFLQGLSSFPEGSEVAWINTCSAPLHYGMPSEMLSRIHDVLKKKKFNMAGVAENNFVLCTCETTNVVFFTKVPQTRQDDADK